ncbi:MAG: glucose 1-dehydrogenase [Myxococcales bacterium]|nr:MAG: glucose 1-dehydrogenase [Myxococcales bacterium]
MGRVEGKVAIVTGGGSGIGRASCELLAREGAAVVVADLDAESAERVARGIVDAGGRAIAQPVDVKQAASIEAMVQAAVAAFGALHVLYNNAADTSLRAMEQDGALLDVSAETWDHVLAVDLRSVFLGCKAAIPHMLEAGGGSIVNASSNQALAGDLSQTAYASAKAAIHSLSLSVATQYGRQGIRCNVVSPGPIRTPAFDRACPPEVAQELTRHSLVPRLGRPEDLAHAVLFLASDEAAYITGQILRVDGGQLAHLPHYAMLTHGGLTTTRRG